MKIALIGYGKMGKIIEETAISRGHIITAKSNRTFPIEHIDFSQVDVAIEFTAPNLAVNHMKYCIDQKTPVVVGTTAWNDELPAIKEYAKKNDGTLLYASNFSIGVNIFFDINRRLAKLMSNYPEYDVNVSETHHTAKLDAPSGTAVSIANDILFENDQLSSWIHKENEVPATSKDQFGVTSYREEGVPGTHHVAYTSEIDTLELSHTAHNRQGFALGAVVAAEWLQHKKGVFTMQDVVKF